MKPAPHFIIIGAMKCATSSLHEQLASQPGFFMSTPKEPSFFSNDGVFANGFDWYGSLFAAQPLTTCAASRALTTPSCRLTLKQPGECSRPYPGSS